jgi:ketosteroid isomerase-like protein
MSRSGSVEWNGKINPVTMSWSWEGVEVMFIMSKFTVKTANADAEAVIEEFLDALEAMSVERFLNVWHADGVQIMPLSPDGFPARLEGKEAIRRQYWHLPTYYKFIRFPDRVYYFTNDPKRVWVEFRGEIQIMATGKSYNNNFVSLFTLRDGRIIEYKEYSSPFTLLTPFLGSEALRKNLSQAPKK